MMQHQKEGRKKETKGEKERNRRARPVRLASKKGKSASLPLVKKDDTLPACTEEKRKQEGGAPKVSDSIKKERRRFPRLEKGLFTRSPKKEKGEKRTRPKGLHRWLAATSDSSRQEGKGKVYLSEGKEERGDIGYPRLSRECAKKSAY